MKIRKQASIKVMTMNMNRAGEDRGKEGGREGGKRGKEGRALEKREE